MSAHARELNQSELSERESVSPRGTEPPKHDRPKEPLFRVWLSDALHAVQSLLSTPRYSLPALLSLALGIAASTAVFAIFSSIVLRPLPFPDEAELVDVRLAGVSEEGDRSGGLSLSFTFHSEFKDRQDIFQALAGYKPTGVTITGSGQARHASAAQVTLDFFDTLRPDPEVGRTFTAKGSSPDPSSVAVLSHSYWVTAYGGAPVVNTNIIVNGKPKTVLGVIPDDRALPARADLWFPIEPSEEERAERFLLGLNTIGRLAPGVSEETARDMLRAASTAQDIHSPDGNLIYGTMLSLRDSLVGDKRTSALLMLVAVGAFLLLACANVASLLVTRASLRSRERAIRAALGASPATLARETGLEALALTIVGGSAGLGLAAIFVTLANRLFASELEYTPARLDGRVLVAFVAVALLSTFVIGLAPMLHAVRIRPMDSLRADGRSTSSRGARRFRELLVALQVAMTLSLLVSAAVLIRSVQNLQATSPGFDTNAVGARVLLPDARKENVEQKSAFAKAILARAEHLPGVKAAAIASDLPFSNEGVSLGLQLEPRAPKPNAVARLRLVGPGYFKAMGIPLISGRAFESADAAPNVHHVIVTRAFALQHLGTLDALGKKLSYREHEEGPVGPDGKRAEGPQIWYDIIGVAEDTLDTSMTQPPEPLVYVHAEAPNAMALIDSGFAIVATGPSDPSALVTALATVARDVDRDAAVYEVTVLGDLVESSYRQRTTLEYLLTAFALASVILAAIGLFGVTSYAVAERSGEIGIRRALGASRGAIVAMILRETGVIVAIGMVFGLACALSARTLLASFLYGVGAADPLVYVVVCLGLGVVAMLAALAPARAAASVMPSRALEAT